MSNIIKIYGLRTSGSNWLQWLLENNINDTIVLRNQLAWKHGNPTNKIDWTGEEIYWDDKHALGYEYGKVLDSIKYEKLKNGKNILEIKDEVEEVFNSGKLIHCFIVKHPYSWMHSRVIKRNKNLEQEIRDWNERIKSYFEFDYPSKIVISYEKLNMNPKLEIENICNKFLLNIKSDFRDTNDNLTHGFISNGTRKKLNHNFLDFFKNDFKVEQLLKIDSLIDEESLKLYNSL